MKIPTPKQNNPVRSLTAVGLSLVLLLGSGITGACRASEPTVRNAETLSPGDLGMRKVLFEVRTAEGQVVVFRREKFKEGEFVERYDHIVNNPHGDYEDHVLLIDHGFFNAYSTGNYTIRTRSSIHNFQGMMRSLRVDSDSLRMVFSTYREGRIEYVYSMFAEDYAELKKQYPNLPESKETWSHGERVRSDD